MLWASFRLVYGGCLFGGVFVGVGFGWNVCWPEFGDELDWCCGFPDFIDLVVVLCLCDWLVACVNSVVVACSLYCWWFGFSDLGFLGVLGLSVLRLGWIGLLVFALI